MKVINSKENSQEHLNNSTLNEVMNILNLSKPQQAKFHEKFWDINNADLIEKILKHDDELRKNIELAQYAIRYIWSEEFKNFSPLFNNKQTCLIAVWASHFNYHFLDNSLKKDTDIWEKTIISMINDREDYDTIIKFIENNFSENKTDQEKLLAYYKKSIKKSQQIYIKDLNKCFVTLENDFPGCVKELIEKNIINKDKKSYIISKDFYNNLENIIQNIPWDLEKSQRERKIKEIIIEQLDLPNNIQKKYVNFLVETIQKNISISKQSIQVNKKSEKQEEWKTDNITKQDNKSDNILDRGINYTWDIDEDLDYFYPECNYTFSSWYYHIEVTGNKTIDLDENQMQNFTSVALKNFVKFYGLLYDLGLNFLWDKYQTDFITLCNNKVWLDYTSNEWITESKSLSILNIIGKNIWIPETKLWIIDDEGNEKTQLKCFKTIADAKLAFWDVKSTWKINGEYIMEPGTFSNYSIVEAYMIQNELVDSKRNSINISKFK